MHRELSFVILIDERYDLVFVWALRLHIGVENDFGAIFENQLYNVAA